MLTRIAGIGVLSRATATLISDGEFIRSLNCGKSIPLEQLQASYSKLESDYREKSTVAPIEDPAAALSYVAVRMNPIYSVLHHIFAELRSDFPASSQPESLLDIGSGPGTALFAACSVWDGIRRIVAVERQKVLIAVAGAMVRQFQQGGELALPFDNLSWECAAIQSWKGAEQADLSVASYMLGELPETDVFSSVDAIWARTRQALIMVEPGTPQGFARLFEVRRRLIGQGAYIVAPCGGNWECQSRWCHFSMRVPRTRLHQSIKEATLGYEDEHFSYVVASREALPFTGARIVGRIRSNKFQTVVPVCSEGGALCEVTYAKRSQPREYREAQRWHWGGRVASVDKP